MMLMRVVGVPQPSRNASFNRKAYAATVILGARNEQMIYRLSYCERGIIQESHEHDGLSATINKHKDGQISTQ
jgi:hypothetical protein